MDDISPCSFTLAQAFYHSPKSSFSWFVQVTVWVQVIAHMSCQGLIHVTLTIDIFPIRQAFTNCMHSYNLAHKQHYTYTKIWARYWFFCVKISWISQSPTQTIMLWTIKTTTTTVFLISNTVALNPYSHSRAFDPQSFAPSS